MLLFMYFRGKSIQIHRNPADVAVSFYHHLKEMKISELSYDWNEFISKMYCNKDLSEWQENSINA